MANSKNTSTIKDVEKYLAGVPKQSRAALEELRHVIRSLVPEAVEVISYQVPTFKLDGRMLVSYAAFAEHCSFFPGAGPVDIHQDQLKSFHTSKGTIRFTPDKPIPAALLKKLVRTRIRLNQEQQQRRATQKAAARRAGAR